MKARALISEILDNAACARSAIGRRGLALSPADVDQDELKAGLKVEMEHTRGRKVAERVALDHLAEDPKYYSKLKRAGLADELKKSPLGRK